MADDVAITAGAGTIIAADDIAGVFWQRVKVGFGADGSASDVSGTNPLPVRPGACSTATLSNVNDSASNVTLLISNASRLGVMIVNDSTQTLYAKYGATASLTSFTVAIEPGGYWEMPSPIYTGQIDGIWSADASGAARITELT